jgi:predicted signal transduction protein with EAL and GGDEF domain
LPPQTAPDRRDLTLVSLLVLDLDDFGKIDGLRGHDEGDVILPDAGLSFDDRRSRLRRADAPLERAEAAGETRAAFAMPMRADRLPLAAIIHFIVIGTRVHPIGDEDIRPLRQIGAPRRGQELAAPAAE